MKPILMRGEIEQSSCVEFNAVKMKGGIVNIRVFRESVHWEIANQKAIIIFGVVLCSLAFSYFLVRVKGKLLKDTI